MDDRNDRGAVAELGVCCASNRGASSVSNSEFVSVTSHSGVDRRVDDFCTGARTFLGAISPSTSSLRGRHLVRSFILQGVACSDCSTTAAPALMGYPHT